MRIGVIGCGLWGRNHARTLAGLGALGGVADTEATASAALAAEVGCRSATVQDLIDDPALDGIVVAVPATMQSTVALRVLAARRHLLVEKPIALDLAQARAVLAAADSAGVVAMTGHLLRYHPAFEAIEALQAAGTLGPLRHLATQRGSWGRFPAGTDVLFDLLPHDLSMIRALAGTLDGAPRWQGRSLVSGLCDIAELWLDLPGGLTAHCSVSRVAPERQRRLVVQGSAATVVFDDTRDWDGKLCLYSHGPSVQGAPTATPLALVPRAPLEAELAHFIDCIATGRPPRTPLADGGAMVEVLTRIASLQPAVATGAGIGLPAQTFPQERARQTS